MKLQNLNINCMALWSAIDFEYNTLVSNLVSLKVRVFLKCEVQILYNIAGELEKINESITNNI